MRFAIRVEEVLGRTFIVNADDLEEAIEKVERCVELGDINLDYDDFCDRSIEPSSTFDNGVVPDERDVSYYDSIH